jgi:hypothetical protein
MTRYPMLQRSNLPPSTQAKTVDARLPSPEFYRIGRLPRQK